MFKGIRSIKPKNRRNVVGMFLWRFVWGPISLFFAFVPLMIVNCLQFLSLLILPFSDRAYYAYNRPAGVAVWGWWAWSLQRLVGVKVTISGDELPADENAIIIANHQSMGDIPAIMCLAMANHRVGDLKWMVKDVVKYVPGVGWGLLFLDCLFLKRKWTEDEAAIKKTFNKYLVRKAPLWLVCFPEGTRITPRKLQASRDYAARAGLDPTSHVLLPRPKGFTASVLGLKTHVSAVYDLTIHYPGATPTLTELMRGDAAKIEIHVSRHQLRDMPQDDKGLSAWLVARLYDKDRRLASMKAASQP